MNDTDIRHIKLIRKLLIEYQNGHINFPNFVNRLDSVIGQFNIKNKDIIESLKAIWFHLEEINAVILDESSNDSIDDYKENIAELNNKLLKHLNSLNRPNKD